MEEYPIKIIPDVPNWSENFASAGFDPAADIGLFCHIGRWRRDLSLWREIVTIALPDGSVIAHRGIGNARATARGPGGTNLHIEVVEPERAFRLTFHGSARRVPEATLLDGLLAEGPHFQLQFDLAFEAVAPVWDLTRVGHTTDFVGAGHVEQFGRLRGAIAFAGERFTIDALVNRDHSRGPRVLDSNLRHHWLQGFLDDGSMFQLYEAEVVGVDGPAYSEVNVVEGGAAFAGRVHIKDKLPFTDNRTLLTDPVELRIEYADKVMDVTAYEFPHTLHLQSTSPNDLYIGVRQIDDVQNTFFIEQSVRYRLADGRRGHGHMERLVPGKLIIDPA